MTEGIWCLWETSYRSSVDWYQLIRMLVKLRHTWYLACIYDQFRIYSTSCDFSQSQQNQMYYHAKIKKLEIFANILCQHINANVFWKEPGNNSFLFLQLWEKISSIHKTNITTISLRLSPIYFGRNLRRTHFFNYEKNILNAE